MRFECKDFTIKFLSPYLQTQRIRTSDYSDTDVLTVEETGSFVRVDFLRARKVVKSISWLTTNVVEIDAEQISAPAVVSTYPPGDSL